MRLVGLETWQKCLCLVAGRRGLALREGTRQLHVHVGVDALREDTKAKARSWGPKRDWPDLHCCAAF